MNIILNLALALTATLQLPDTTGIYSGRVDTLEATVKTAHQSTLPRGKDIRTEVITAAGLCKMACCNLAESFENSASVTVGYSDAVTGARQIRLLGQSGIYTQMLDENRPVMRGLSAPFGLNYVPGQWLESIQIAKGVTSVINGVESMTGQINMEHRKPTDETPLYIQASAMGDSKCDLNIISALQFDEMQKWSTILLGHIDGNFRTMDMNGDGFADDPKQLNLAFSNRWLYFGEDGVQVRFGIRGIRDHRLGGQVASGDGFDYNYNDGVWRADIMNNSLNGYVKVGIPLSETNSSNIAFVLDATSQFLDSGFGSPAYNFLTHSPQEIPEHTGAGYRFYDAFQQSFFANLLYQNEINESHKFTLGLSDMVDIWSDAFCTDAFRGPTLNDAGVFGEYTFHSGDKFSAIVGLRADWYNLGEGLRFSPRVTLKYSPSQQWVFRLNGGRGLRHSNPMIDNFGVLSSSKSLKGVYDRHPLEDSWTLGANATWYIPGWDNAFISADYFHTGFNSQVVLDYSQNSIWFYMAPAGTSYTDNYQIDFSCEPLERFTVTLTGRYTDAVQPFHWTDDIFLNGEKPMTSRYKGVVNLQYATNLNKWIFDFTASVNGPCKVWDYMKGMEVNGKRLYENGYTPVYPLLYAQVTKRFKGFDIYAGGENLTNFRQESPIINAGHPFDEGFDASCVWGPLMGIKLYAGVRITIWKTE